MAKPLQGRVNIDVEICTVCGCLRISICFVLYYCDRDNSEVATAVKRRPVTVREHRSAAETSGTLAALDQSRRLQLRRVFCT